MPYDDVIRKAVGTPAAYVGTPEILAQLNEDTQAYGISLDHAIALRIISLLEDIRLDLLEPPRYDGQPEVLIYAILVQTPGQPQQGPDTPLPPGYALAIRQRVHSTNRTGYIAMGRTETSNTNRRIELRDNLSFSLKVSNMNLLWFDADTANTYFELMVEYSRTSKLTHLK